MRELIRRSLERWQRAQRLDATREDLAAAAAAVPELCAALDAALLRAEEHGAPSPVPDRRSEDDLDRLGRYLAHEVRNRLNLVELSLERAAVLAGDPRVRSALEPVSNAFRHMAAIADDLRSAVSPSGSVASVRSDVPRLPLRELLEDLVATGRDLAESEGVRLEMDAECPEVEVDAARLELVLVNLVTNALRHVDEGKAERWVRVEAGWVDGEERVLHLAVRDNGVGIPESHREALFDDPPAVPGGGPPRSGMGLVIVHRAVERAGGRVWVETDEGLGTAVHFTLPVSGDAVEAREARPPDPSVRRSAGAP